MTELCAVSNADSQIKFLLKLQSLLTEGRFVASYKFALLLAICDLCVEMNDPAEGELKIPLTKIAEKFIVYYWRHVLPYVAGQQSPAVILRQNTGRQAAVIRLVQNAHDRFQGSLPAAQHDPASWSNLVLAVRGVVLQMPLWKLQRVGESVDAFLYRQEYVENDCIALLPEVAQSMRSFHGLISELIRTSWIRYIRQTNSAELQGDRDLTEFLFGAERSQLAAVGQVLTNFQSCSCLYCNEKLSGVMEVDHFIPWSRYPSDLGHNFVLAHRKCNQAKGALLAAEDHLERWVKRNEALGEPLAGELRRVGIVTDWASSREIARWAYEGAAAVNSLLWRAGTGTVSITGYWQTLLPSA